MRQSLKQAQYQASKSKANMIKLWNDPLRYNAPLTNVMYNINEEINMLIETVQLIKRSSSNLKIIW